MGQMPTITCGSSCLGAYMQLTKTFSRSFSAAVHTPRWEAQSLLTLQFEADVKLTKVHS